MGCTDFLKVDVTVVANEFIDKYMPEANGDYVKVYLYMLKNRESGIGISEAAEKLHLTEGDVRRALKYWEDKGIVSATGKEGSRKNNKEDEVKSESTVSEASASDELRDRYKRADGKAVLNALGSDEEFSQLLFIVQKYRSKILSEREQEVLAYLYDGLKLPCDVIDYLVAYCVQTGHNNMRYIEKTGLDWANIGIRDVGAARRRTEQFEEAKNVSRKSRTVKTERQGITRNTDLDDLVRTRILERI